MSLVRIVRLRSRIIVVLLAVFILLSAGWYFRSESSPIALEEAPTYVGRRRCVECHPTQAEAFRDSDHDRAMDVARPDTVLGDFNDHVTNAGGYSSRFFTKDDQFWVTTKGSGGVEQTFPVSHVFGVVPLQQYLIPFPGGRYQVLPLAWDVQQKRWYHLYEKEQLQPQEWLYWTNWGMTWNHQCAECHSTNLQKNYNRESDQYETTFSEIDVSCEACHGPGSRHEKLVDSKRWWNAIHETGLRKLKGTPNTVEVDACGQCHSRRQVIDANPHPFGQLTDRYDPELLDTASYHPDGQIRDENYEYGSFRLSLMYEKGVRCTDCHDPHSTKVKAQGNALCVRCHQAGKFDVPSHHFHAVGSTGSLCVNCHMPTTTYMGIDARRDHGFRIPRPELTESLGIPNACNRCHADRSTAWSKEWTTKWHGRHDWPARIDFADLIAKGRQGDPGAERALIRAATNPSVPATLRASSLALLRRYPSSLAENAAIEGLSDSDALVRGASLRWIHARAGESADTPPTILQRHQDAITKRLTDSSRLVREEAARALSRWPASHRPEALREPWESAERELVGGMLDRSDTPEGDYSLGIHDTERGELRRAAEHYRRALKIEPRFHAARFNLALLYYQNGQAKEAADAFRQVLSLVQEDRSLPDRQVQTWNESLLAETHYHLALLVGEDPRSLAETIAHLRACLAIDPKRHRANYNLAMAEQQLNHLQPAEDALRSAIQEKPNDDDYEYALAALFVKQGRPRDAERVLRRILDRNPNHPSAAILLRQLPRN